MIDIVLIAEIDHWRFVTALSEVFIAFLPAKGFRLKMSQLHVWLHSDATVRLIFILDLSTRSAAGSPVRNRRERNGPVFSTDAFLNLVGKGRSRAMDSVPHGGATQTNVSEAVH
jgi:hypothetical protein